MGFSCLLKCYLTIDTCSNVWLVQCLLSARILKIAKERGIIVTSTHDVVVYHVMCHNHVRNIWEEELAKRINKRLKEVHFDILDEMPPHLYTLFALMNVHRCIDHECNDSAHYTNNHGIDCTNYIQTKYPDVLSSQLLVQLLDNDRMLSERRDWVLIICASIK